MVLITYICITTLKKTTKKILIMVTTEKVRNYNGNNGFIISLQGGLKKYGKYELNLEYFKHHSEKIDYKWDGGSPQLGILFSNKLEKLLGPARKKNEELTQFHKDISHSVQVMYEEAFFNLLNNLHNKYKLNNLAIAGGCAMNSVANGKVLLKTPFKKIYPWEIIKRYEISRENSKYKS